MKSMYDGMSARGKLITKLVGGAIGAAALIGGCGYVVDNVNVGSLVQEPKQTFASALDSKLVQIDPGAYVDHATAYLDAEPGAFEEYRENVSTFVFAADKNGLLNEEAQIYMFNSNASKVDVDTGVNVCTNEVFSRAGPDQKLEVVLSFLGDLEPGDYKIIAGEMLGEVYGNFKEELNEFWPW